MHPLILVGLGAIYFGVTEMQKWLDSSRERNNDLALRNSELVNELTALEENKKESKGAD